MPHRATWVRRATDPLISPYFQPVAAEHSADRLTRRELEVLRLLAQGLSDAQIADQLVLSPWTVHHHVVALYSKLGITSRAAATRCALERGLL